MRRVETDARSPFPSRWLVVALAMSSLTVPSAALAADVEPESGAKRVERLQSEIERLERELEGLRGRERGLLGELERLGAELRLHQAEHDAVSQRLTNLGAKIAERDSALSRLEQGQQERREYLAFRLRELYKAGADDALRRFIGGEGVEDYLHGLDYAAYLSQKDVRVIREFREDAAREAAERERLLADRVRAKELRDEAARARDRAQASRRRREVALNRVREDQEDRRGAIEELRAAAAEMTAFVDTLDASRAGAMMDVHKFKGLLDWPATGEVSAGFGKVIHPRFRTEVPHPGLDIEAANGADIRSIFDGRVVFGDWMRGYGLTVIVDHGSGLLSIYAHASVLLVESGREVERGQSLGKVGDTGSLRGPYLYFELRLDGRPRNPEDWLRPR